MFLESAEKKNQMLSHQRVIMDIFSLTSAPALNDTSSARFDGRSG